MKERTEDRPTENDLRGLGHDPILQLAFPYAFLSIEGAPQAAIEELCHRFSLTLKDSVHSKMVHLVVDHLVEGEQGLQALTLCAAALEIHTAHPGCTSLVEEARPLQHLVHWRARERAAPPGLEDQQAAGWAYAAEKGTLSLGWAVRLHLVRAGIVVSTDPAVSSLALDNAGIESLLKAFSEGSSSTGKAV